MNRPSPELVACMLQAHEEFACKAVDCLAEIADADGEEIRRVVPSLAALACDEAISRFGLSPSDSQRQWMAERVLDEAFGSGPLEPLLRDESSDAIVILGPRDVFLERDGELRETEVVFADEEHIQRLFNRKYGIQKFLERMPSTDGPTWRIDLRGLRPLIKFAEVENGQAAGDSAAAPRPVPSRPAGGLGAWLARLFG